MQLKGLNVFHTKFGRGQIVEVKENNLFDVKMQNGDVKHFIYPDSFSSGVLKFEDEQQTKQSVDDYIVAERRKRIRQRLELKRKQERERDLRREKWKKEDKAFRKYLYKIAYHEAGHTVVGELFFPNSVEEVKYQR